MPGRATCVHPEELELKIAFGNRVRAGKGLPFPELSSFSGTNGREVEGKLSPGPWCCRHSTENDQSYCSIYKIGDPGSGDVGVSIQPPVPKREKQRISNRVMSGVSRSSFCLTRSAEHCLDFSQWDKACICRLASQIERRVSCNFNIQLNRFSKPCSVGSPPSSGACGAMPDFVHNGVNEAQHRYQTERQPTGFYRL